jgi:hypothetical protein
MSRDLAIGDCGVVETQSYQKFQITNPKFQTNHNDQSASGGPNPFWSLKLGTRPQGGESGGPILEFGAWNLRFYYA